MCDEGAGLRYLWFFLFLSPQSARKTARIYRIANIVLLHGKTAVIALASRGIGPETASRVIRKLREDKEEFYRDILIAERNYAKTKRFWE